MLVDVTLQDRHRDEVVRLLHRQGGAEAAAYVLFGEASIDADPWTRYARRRLSSYKVESVPDGEVISADEQHVTWSTRSFVRLCRQAKEQGLVPGIAHSHPGNFNAFSAQDDRNERDIYRLARNRNGNGTAVASLLLIGEQDFRARLWVDDSQAVNAESVLSVGRELRFYDEAMPIEDEVLERQARALGPALNTRLKRLKVGVVGCGGTGSATAMLLARLGIGQLVLFDEDIVEASNLNRLHGARKADSDVRRAKVDVLAREIAAMGIGTHVVPMRCWVDSLAARDALRSCDVLFGCTDDHAGRLFLNRVAYFYLRPVIDMGLAIEPAPDGGLREVSSRVTVLTPGASCLVCRGIVNSETAREEALKRQFPEEHERLRREAYVRRAGNPAPAVVTFTTETACMAVNELLQGLIDFRRKGHWEYQRNRWLDRGDERLQGAKQKQTCPVCIDRNYWGLGDTDPFLDRVS